MSDLDRDAIKARAKAATQSVAWTQAESWTSKQGYLHKLSVADVPVLLAALEEAEQERDDLIVQLHGANEAASEYEGQKVAAIRGQAEAERRIAAVGKLVAERYASGDDSSVLQDIRAVLQSAEGAEHE